MPSNSTKYAVDVLLDPENLPSEDKSVIWDQSSGSFAIGDAPSSGGGGSSPQFIYQVHDGVRLIKNFQTGTPTGTPTETYFRCQPDGQSNSNRSLAYFNGASTDRFRINLDNTAERDYVTRGGNNEEILCFTYNYNEPRAFFCWRGQYMSAYGNANPRFDYLQYIDWQYNPWPQTFSPTSFSTNNRWFRSETSYMSHGFIFIAPQTDTYAGNIYRNGGADDVNETDWLILNTRPSGSTTEITNYLKSYEGGKLTFTELDNPERSVTYKFDESFEIRDNDADDFFNIGLVAFTGLKVLHNSTSGTNADTKYAVTVDSVGNDFHGHQHNNKSILNKSGTVTRRVKFTAKGQSSYLGRRYEWGTRHTQDYSVSSYTQVVGGQFYLRSYYSDTVNDGYRGQQQGVWSLGTSNQVLPVGSNTPAGQGFIIGRIVSATVTMISNYGPILRAEFPNNQATSNVPNDDVEVVVSYNFTKQNPQSS